jgi:hypothetical protein
MQVGRSISTNGVDNCKEMVQIHNGGVARLRTMGKKCYPPTNYPSSSGGGLEVIREGYSLSFVYLHSMATS